MNVAIKTMLSSLLTLICMCVMLACANVAFASEGAPLEASLSEQSTTSEAIVAVEAPSSAARTEAQEQENAVIADDDVDVIGLPASDAPASIDVQAAQEPEQDPISDSALGAQESSSTIDVYRLYNRATMEHLYTTDAYERMVLLRNGWVNEGIGWVAPKQSFSPVFRLCNLISNEHIYTADRNEYKVLSNNGWRDEGICWFSDDEQRVAIHRQFNPAAGLGAHHYTTSAHESKVLTTERGWSYEKISWYGVKEGTPVTSTSHIYLDAGHGWGSGSYDPGAGGCGYKEADLTAELATKVAQYAMNTYGLNVYTNAHSTQSNGLSYQYRQGDAQAHGCTSLVSIHFNASDGGGRGSESFIHSVNAAEGSELLQSIMHKALIQGTGLVDRGKKTAALAVCSGIATGIPATLLEICFIDNSNDMKVYQSKIDEIAQELAAGLFEASQKGF